MLRAVLKLLIKTGILTAVEKFITVGSRTLNEEELKYLLLHWSSMGIMAITQDKAAKQ